MARGFCCIDPNCIYCEGTGHVIDNEELDSMELTHDDKKQVYQALVDSLTVLQMIRQGLAQDAAKLIRKRRVEESVDAAGALVMKSIVAGDSNARAKA